MKKEKRKKWRRIILDSIEIVLIAVTIIIIFLSLGRYNNNNANVFLNFSFILIEAFIVSLLKNGIKETDSKEKNMENILIITYKMLILIINIIVLFEVTINIVIPIGF